LGFKISYEKEKDFTSKVSKSPQSFEIQNVLKPNSVQRQSPLEVHIVSHISPHLYMVVKCDMETEGYKNTKDNRDEIQETESRIHFIKPKKKQRHFR